jgi:hypothetical protein
MTLPAYYLTQESRKFNSESKNNLNSRLAIGTNLVLGCPKAYFITPHRSILCLQ